MTTDHDVAFSRRGLRPRFGWTCPSKRRGSRECRVLAAPAVSCAMCTRKCAHEHTGTAGALRHSLRNGFTAYAELSPETNSSCLRRCRLDGGSSPVGIDLATDSLTPATGARTTRFCRTQRPSSSRGFAGLKCKPAEALAKAEAPFVLRAVHRSRIRSALRSPCAPALSRPPHPVPRS